MLSRIIAVALLAATFSANAGPAQPAAKPAEKTAVAPESKDEVVCTVEHTTGSHLPRRTCEARSVRDERARHDQQAMRDMHNQTKALSSGR